MNLGDLFKQAKDVQAKTQAVHQQLAALETEGSAGAGLVHVILTGKSELKKITVDPSLLKPENREMLEDLIVAAHADARNKLERLVAEEMQRLAREMGLPSGLVAGS